MRELPEYGRLPGRGRSANLEVVLRFKPDLIFDSGRVEQFPENLRDTTRAFYKLLYEVDLSDGQLDTLLSSTTSPRPEKKT